MSKADFRKAVEMSPNTMTKMCNDEEASMGVLLKIATLVIFENLLRKRRMEEVWNTRIYIL